MSGPQEVVFGGVPAWLLAEYLVELGGQKSDVTGVTGDGWSATLVAGARPLGSLSIGRVTVTIAGQEARRVLQQLRKKAQRGGG